MNNVHEKFFDFIGRVYRRITTFLLIKLLFSIVLIPVLLTVFGMATYQISKWISKEELFFSVAQTLTVKTFGTNSYLEIYLGKLRDKVIYDTRQLSAQMNRREFSEYSNLSVNDIYMVENNNTISSTNKRFLIHMYRDLLNLKYDMINRKYEQNLSGIVDQVRLIINGNNTLPHECMNHKETVKFIYLPIRSCITEGRLLSKSITVEDLSQEIKDDHENYTPSFGTMTNISVTGLGSEYASILTDQLKKNCQPVSSNNRK